jgi:hypothetical protein
MDRIFKLVVAATLVVIAVKLPWPQATAETTRADVVRIHKDSINDLASCIAFKNKSPKPFEYENRCPK